MSRRRRILTLALAAIGTLAAGGGTARAEGDCVPACRDGFVCHDGRCISACNPPCGPGQVCVEGRQCIVEQGGAPPPDAQGGVPVVDQSQAAGSQVVVIEDSSAGYAAGPTAYPQPYAQPQPVAQPAPEPEYQDPMFAVNANMLGFLQFGPVLSLEIGGSFAGFARVRFPNAGMFNYVDFDLDIDKSEEISFGMAAGGGVRYYLSSRGTLRGFYLGAALEIEYTEWSVEDCSTGILDCQNFDDEQTRLITLAQLGWRWGWSSFFFGVGGELGYASVLGYSRYDADGYTVDSSSDGVVWGMVSLELGFYL